MADRFYVNCALAPGPVLVEGPEAHHLAVVCRVRPGAAVCLFNGDGRQYLAEVREVGRKSVVLEVGAVEAPQREHPFRVEVAAPLPKGDRAQFLIEKLTELGVSSFTPLQTARSVVHPREGKQEKLQRYVIEASKQCGRNVLMEIGPLTEWKTLIERADLPGRKLLAHVGGTACGRIEPPTNVVAAVGPEGGFTDEEVERARAAGWEVVGLGPRHPARGDGGDGIGDRWGRLQRFTLMDRILSTAEKTARAEARAYKRNPGKPGSVQPSSRGFGL